MIAEIVKTNESYIKIYSEFQIEQEIKDYFTFEVPGAKYSPKYKARVWDGKISLYNIRTKQLPIGLYPRLEEFCQENGIEIQFKECERYSKVWHKSDVDRKDVEDFVHSLNLWSENGPLEIRDYQIDAIYTAIKERRVTLLSPTSSGKSLIIYCFIRWFLEEDPEGRLLLLVPTVQLVNQMVSDFREYSIQNKWDTEKFIQKLYAGQTKELSKRILITTWQSFAVVSKDKVKGPQILSLYKAVIADEAHGSKGTEMQAILEKCAHATYRIGTTGTLDDKKVHKLVIEGFLGPIYKVITTRELMDRKQVTNLNIVGMVLKYSQEEAKLIKSADYQEEIDWLVKNEARNKFIIKMTQALEGTTLVLVKNRDTHAKVLYERAKLVSKKPVYYVAGDVDVDEREAIRKLANKEDCTIFATFKSMSTGVNIPNIRNVIFGTPSKSSIQVLQSIGRGLRLHENKLRTILIDIIDDLRYKKSENYAYQHATERLTIYRKEKFEISLKEVELNVR